MTAERDDNATPALTRRAGIVASGTLASRVLGAVRDAVIAATFVLGATDAFWLAFTIPNALRVLLGEGAVSAAFVPVFTEVREKEGLPRARLFLGRLLAAMVLLLTVVTGLGMLATPWIVKAYAWGFQRDPELYALTVLLTRAVFPYIFLMGIAALAMAALYAMKRFTAPSFAPAMLNVALIAAALSLAPVMNRFGLPGIAALAVGALIGGALQVLVQVPSLKRANVLTGPRFQRGDPYVGKTFTLMVPLVAGLGVYQLNILLSRLFASFLPTGSLSYLYYGQRLAEIPQGMFALAIASAALPSLSEHVARGDRAGASRVFAYAIRMTLFVAVPATVGLMLLAEPVITMLFGRGHFEASAITETTRSFTWQAAGIWAVALVRTTVPMFHAHNDTKTPVIASALNLLVFVALSLRLMPSQQHVGLAIAMTAAAAAQLVALFVLLRRRTGGLDLEGVGRSLVRIGCASATMGAFLWWARGLGRWELGGNHLPNVLALAGILAIGAIIYAALMALFRAPELLDVYDALRRRARGTSA